MLWLKALHIVMIVSWFAGLFYLPRIFVNLAQETDPNALLRLNGMAHRLYRFMTPLAVIAMALGLWLMFYYGLGLYNAWMHAKLLLVLGLVIYHLRCGKILKKFTNNENKNSHVYYRWFNEIPVIILLIIVILVVVKPF